MHISQEDINLFFKLHPSLLQYVNQRLNLLSEIKTPEELRTSGVENIALARKELWKRLEFIEEFIMDNPFGFSKDECAVIAGWKNVVQGKFYIFRHLKKYSVFLTETEPTKAYAVCSLNTPLNEMFWKPPIYTQAVLIPFRDRIIYDGILYPYSITFGPGFRFDLNESYREAKSTFGIIENLDIS